MVLMFLGAPFPLEMVYCASNQFRAVLSEYSADADIGEMLECLLLAMSTDYVERLTCKRAVKAIP